MPIESYFSLATQSIEYTGLDARIKYAILIGSQSLASALARTRTNKKDLQKDRSKLLRYLIRMSSRCTPYGLFAGVAMAELGERTDLELADHSPQTYTRPDMEWLCKLVNKMEGMDEILGQLNISVNPSAFQRAGRFYLQERLSAGKDSTEPRVSIRVTNIVRQVLEFAEKGIPHHLLVKHLVETNPTAPKDKIEKLLKALLEQTVLVTNLRPPLTTANPALHILKVLAANPAASTHAEEFRGFLEQITACDKSLGSEAFRLFPQMKHTAEAIIAASDKPVVQVDSARHLSGSHISAQVGDSIARAAELMLAMSPYPKGYQPLGKYYSAFVEKHGTDRKVALLELLDPNFGLGIPTEYVNGIAESSGRANSSERNDILLQLAVDAIRDKQLIVDLDDRIVDKLKTWNRDEDNAPASLDICALVAASAPEDIDAGNFKVVIGPNLGASSAGKMLGRFAHLLGDKAYDVLRDLAALEQRQTPDKLFAELVYLPRKYRAGNVAIRPSVYTHEITFGVSPSVEPDKVIPLRELAVSGEGGHFHLYWTKNNQEVIIASGHMLNSYGAPSLCRFLSDIGRPVTAGFSNFDWGPASNLPFLPRIQVGKVVLSIAEWRISKATFAPEAVKSSAKFANEFAKWHKQWNATRYMYLANGDNRLLLDILSPAHVEEIRDALHHDHAVVLQEAYPGPEHAWVPGPDGHYLMEAVASLITAAIPEASDGKKIMAVPATPQHTFFEMVFRRSSLSQERLCPPGSDWLFIKLYCGRELEEDLLLEGRSFCARMVAKGYAEDYFFIRYSDPEPHIRLRFHGNPKRLTTKLYPEVCAWATDMQAQSRCLKFVFDTYDREIERYGGIEAICLAEKLFAADSESVLDLLHLEKHLKDGPKRLIIAVRSIHQLLADMGLDDTAQIDWCKDYDDLWDTVAELYRKEQKQLRLVLSDTAKALGPDIASVFVQRRSKLEIIAKHYNELSQDGKLCVKYGSILRSMVHMHCNRFIGTDNIEELKAIALLSRTLHSLSAMKSAHTSPKST